MPAITDIAELLIRRRRTIGSAAPLFYDRPLHLIRGEGVWVEDHEGRRYLDCYNNVPHVGHCHPDVVRALTEQAGLLNIHTRYLHENVVLLAERFLATMDEPLSAVTFCCTGTEANELALRMARFGSGNNGIIVSDFNYHGNSSTLAGATTGLPAPEALAPYARAIRIPDRHRDPSGAQALAGLEQAIASLRQSGQGVAALLVDTLFTTEGLPDVPDGWLAQATALVRQAGGYLIADEVQPGFGRTGEAMWGYQLHGVSPDFVTTGKSMGNGHPISAVATSLDMMERFGKAALYFNTFGGNPVSCAVALAVLDVIDREKLIDNAAVVGAHAQPGLARLTDKYPVVLRKRGKGLFFGLELVDPATGVPASDVARRVINRMREDGVLISKIGPDDNILKIRPPMPISAAEIDIAMDRLDTALENSL